MATKLFSDADKEEIARAYQRISPQCKNDTETFCVMNATVKINGEYVSKSTARKYKDFPVKQETQVFENSNNKVQISFTGVKEIFDELVEKKENSILERARINTGINSAIAENATDDDLLELEPVQNPSSTWNINKPLSNTKTTIYTEGSCKKKSEVYLTNSDPETSGDYEIKPSPVKTFRKFEEHEHYPLSKAERWLILPDTQIPYHDQKTLDAVLQYASENYYDGCIQLGDFMDWEFISRWTKDNARKIEGQRFLQEYIHGNAVLDQIQTAVRNKNKDAHLIILEGNHDWRIENVVNQTPALEGLIEMDKNLRLAERKITFWRYWIHRKPFVIGKAWFIHGEYIGTNHAKKTAESFVRNVWYGHTHDVMSYTKTTAWGDSIQCGSLGTLSIMDLEYMGHRPSNWQQAFAEFFFQPDGHFNHYVTNIYNNEFIAINGRKYKG